MQHEYTTQEAKSIIENEYENWIRWTKDRSFTPKNPGSVLGPLAINEENKEKSAEWKPEIDNLAAAAFEEIVISLPSQQRLAFLLYSLRRAVVKGKMKIARRYGDEWKIMGRRKRWYYTCVQFAFNSIVRKLGYGTTN